MPPQGKEAVSSSGKAETKPGGHSRTGPDRRGDVGKWQEGPALETDRKEDKRGLSGKCTIQYIDIL